MNTYTVAALAEHIGACVLGDGDIVIDAAGSLEDGKCGEIGFLAESRYEKYLAQSKLSAVLVSKAYESLAITQLVVPDVKKAWRTLVVLFENTPSVRPGIHPGALVDANAVIGREVSIGAGAVIDAGAVVADGCQIAPLAYIGEGVVLGEHCIIGSGVRLLPRTVIGARAHILANAVIGERGFGFSLEQGCWQPIAQIGGVVIGDDVEIGACTTIDRGAVRDTVIGNRVKLDNQIQIGHNVVIGDDTIIAGATVIAGSVRFGRHCVIGGCSVFAGHITVCDGAQFAGHSSVSKSVTKPGLYCSALTVMPDRQWKRFVAKLHIFAKDKHYGKSVSDGY